MARFSARRNEKLQTEKFNPSWAVKASELLLEIYDFPQFTALIMDDSHLVFIFRSFACTMSGKFGERRGKSR
jgi:hypothetical protein